MAKQKLNSVPLISFHLVFVILPIDLSLDIGNLSL